MKIVAIFNENISNAFLEDLAKLLVYGFGDDINTWIKRFKFWWSSPYLSKEIPACWVVTDNEGNLLGFNGNIPIYYQHGSDKIFGIGSTTYYMNPNARGTLSTVLGMLPTRDKAFKFVISNTVNDTSKKMFENMGYQHIKYISNEAYHVTNYIITIQLKSFLTMVSWLLNHFIESKQGFEKVIYIIGYKYLHAISRLMPHITIKQTNAYLLSPSYKLKICHDIYEFMQYLPLHKRGDTIELSKDETTLQWILFSHAVQDLLQRKSLQIFTTAGEYCGYLIYDIQHVGKTTVLRIRELQLLKPDDAIIKLILKHAKIEARNNSCAAVYSALQNPDSEVDRLLSKHILLRLKTDNRYYVKFKKGVFTDIDPYSIYVPSDLDPDVGFI